MAEDNEEKDGKHGKADDNFELMHVLHDIGEKREGDIAGDPPTGSGRVGIRSPGAANHLHLGECQQLSKAPQQSIKDTWMV